MGGLGKVALDEHSPLAVRIHTCVALLVCQSQIHSQAEVIVELEMREQKLLTDLKNRSQKVVELQMQLETKEEELKAASKAAKQNKMTKVANEVPNDS